MAHRDWIKVSEASMAMREHNDCGVRALCLTTNGNYRQAHEALARAGRRKRKGTYPWQVQEAAKRMGYQVHPSIFPQRANGSKYTAKTIGAAYPTGIWIVEYRGHFAAMVEGEILDWTNERAHRVIGLRLVTRLGRDI